MSENLFTYDGFTKHYSANGQRILKYSTQAFHSGLNEHKMLSAPERYILSSKLESLKARWNEKWDKIVAKNIIEAEKERNLSLAQLRTEEAQKSQDEISNLLSHLFKIKDELNWDDFKRFNDFDVVKPKKLKLETLNEMPEKPKSTDAEFIPRYSLLDKLFKSLKKKKIERFELKLQDAISDWDIERVMIEEENKKIRKKNNLKKKDWERKFKEWEKDKAEFNDEKQQYNENIVAVREGYSKKKKKSIEKFVKLLLENSVYPEFIENNFDLQYDKDNQILVIDYSLPDIDALPRIKEVKYIISKKEFKDIYISEPQANRIYDDCIYRITLRTVGEIFQADTQAKISAITFNGWVNSVNKATGKMQNKCILSLQVQREKFIGIELVNVDPKTCFKSLKGIASSKLVSHTAIQPLMQINKDDKRFVSSYEVSPDLDDSTNIAAMDWKDFEHFVREIFEREFSSNGGEVKVTQASRDGGVDAIAFDPDPIKGGKIVIQAKRYTNTVDVSAVRDLYGTVMNEGATKGILVTTSNYGPDAYDFAKDKPITLMNGAHLLQLLEKQGQKVKIDLVEAKKLNKEEK